MQKITKEHRNLVFFFFFFLPNSISMEVDGSEESRNVGIVREGVESNHRYRPSRVPTHSGPPSRHRKLHAADNFARRGRYIGVITIITLLAVFSPWFFAEPYGKLHYIYIFLFFLSSRPRSCSLRSAKIFVWKRCIGGFRYRGAKCMQFRSFFNRDRNASGRFHAIRSFVRVWNVEKSEVNCGCNVRGNDNCSYFFPPVYRSHNRSDRNSIVYLYRV